MNLLIVDCDELSRARLDAESHSSPTLLTLQDQRAKHIVEVLRANIGDRLKAGIVGGNIGHASIKHIDTAAMAVMLEIDNRDFTQPPPAPLNCRVFVALPRPKAARRILRLLAELGVKEIHFFHCYKVEKSYWSSPLLEPVQVDEQFKLGLAQAMDTMLPVLHQRRLFKPFVEDVLPELCRDETLLLGDPAGETSARQALLARSATQGISVVIGPEGGLTPYEIDKFIEAGARKVGLGRRIFRSEVALAQLLAEVRSL